MTDEIAQSLGFASATEFHRLVSMVDMSSMDQARAFQHWKRTDGTKTGLDKLTRHPSEPLQPGDRVTTSTHPGSRGTFKGYLQNLCDARNPAAAIIWDAGWRLPPFGAAKTLSRVVDS